MSCGSFDHAEHLTWVSLVVPRHGVAEQGDMKQLRSLIGNDYRVHMQLDNLPVAVVRDDR